MGECAAAHCWMFEARAELKKKKTPKKNLKVATWASAKLAVQSKCYLGCCWRRCLELGEVKKKKKKTHEEKGKGHVSPSVHVLKPFQSGRSLSSVSSVASLLAKLLALHTLPKQMNPLWLYFYFTHPSTKEPQQAFGKGEAKLKR